jgi:3'-phosphoadenosine 5'-phosphosulfate sulfotransferase
MVVKPLLVASFVGNPAAERGDAATSGTNRRANEEGLEIKVERLGTHKQRSGSRAILRKKRPESKREWIAFPGTQERTKRLILAAIKVWELKNRVMD